MTYGQFEPRPNVWRANMSVTQECAAAKTDWSVDISSSVEAWSIFKVKFSSVTSPFIPCLVPRRPNNCPP
ncbi:unnamed protein product [Schistosoma mattheei]|uniref:Uncharacterized protein n=1 Tax=Schistosoma mattheei TaxID=31246 RepID=A0A183Q1J6_9TREM|nr:unnamed protein product [Schistosoma mattheei]